MKHETTGMAQQLRTLAGLSEDKAGVGEWPDVKHQHPHGISLAFVTQVSSLGSDALFLCQSTLHACGTQNRHTHSGKHSYTLNKNKISKKINVMCVYEAPSRGDEMDAERTPELVLETCG